MRLRLRPFKLMLSIFALIAFGVPVLTGGAQATSRHPRPPRHRSHLHVHKILFPTRSAWRHGIGNLGSAGSMSSVAPLVYQGGAADGIGVTTGTPQVFVVFWGSQWGSPVVSGGFTVASNDPSGLGLRLEQMYAGLGTDGEKWSGVMTEYCQGVVAGTIACPAGVSHVGLPGSSGVLSGVWLDSATPAPSRATDSQIAAEAVSAAGHFQNLTAGENRNAQYIVVSPTGTHPGGFNTPRASFCAWHDWSGDSSLDGGPAPSAYGDIAFTNMPYVTDAGTGCGANYVNPGSAGALDGVTIVAGHEYAETLTDQIPAGGWLDASGNENGDKCAWAGVGGASGAQDLTFATGSFPMQATWSNLAGACEISELAVPTTSTSTSTTSTISSTTTTTTAPIPATTTTTTAPVTVTTTAQPSPAITIVNPGTQQLRVRVPVRITLSAIDSAQSRLFVRVVGLPRGLSNVRYSGKILGVPRNPGTFNVRVFAYDLAGNSERASFQMVIGAFTRSKTGQSITKHDRVSKSSKHPVSARSRGRA